MDDGFDEFMKEYRKGNRRSIRWDNVADKCFRIYHSGIVRKVKRLPEHHRLRKEVMECLDLLGAIQEYRKIPDKEVYLARYPDFEFQRDNITLLWNEFSSKSPEDMADMVHEMYAEIDMLLGGNL